MASEKNKNELPFLTTRPLVMSSASSLVFLLCNLCEERHELCYGYKRGDRCKSFKCKKKGSLLLATSEGLKTFKGARKPLDRSSRAVEVLEACALADLVLARVDQHKRDCDDLLMRDTVGGGAGLKRAHKDI